MRIGKAATIMAAAALSVVMTLSAGAVGADYTGFDRADGGTRYYVNGEYQTGWQTVGDGRYYFGRADGYMFTGARLIGGAWYVFDGEGKLDTAAKNGFFTEKGVTRYYVDGVYQTGWLHTGDGTYYLLKATGEVVTGQKTIGGTLYVFDEDGRMIPKNGLIEEKGGTRFYIDDVYQTGWQLIGSYRYYFYRATGLMATGDVVIGGKPYSIPADGRAVYVKTGFVGDADGIRYYSDEGVMLTGWQNIGGDRLYFYKATGLMVTASRTVGGVWYDFEPFERDGLTLFRVHTDKNGFVADGGGTRYYIDDEYQTGWQTVGAGRYYFAADGYMATGTVEIDGRDYIFGSDGVFVRAVKQGFYTEDGGIRYYIADVMQTGWQTVGDDTLYFLKATGLMSESAGKFIGGEMKYFHQTEGTDAEGNAIVLWVNHAVRDGFVADVNGTRYYVNDRSVTGWCDIGENRYYFYLSTGYMVTESRFIGGVWYDFNADGTLVKTPAEDPAERETAAMKTALRTNAVWNSAAFTKKYTDKVTVTSALIKQDFKAALGVSYTVTFDVGETDALVAAYAAAAYETAAVQSVTVTLSGTEGGSVSAVFTFSLTKISTITVSDAINLSTYTGMPAGEAGVHGGHQTRVLHTSYGDYMAYICNDSIVPSYSETFAFVRIDGEDTEVLFTGGTPSDSVYILADRNENIYLVTGSCRTTGDSYSTYISNVTVWQYDRVSGKMKSYYITKPLTKGNSYGYLMATLDPVTEKIYIMFCGGGRENDGYFAWYIFDLKTKTYRNEIGYRNLGAAHRFCYGYLFPDGKGGISILGQRDVLRSYLGLPGSGFSFDQLHLFTISDLYSSDVKAYTETVVVDGKCTDTVVPNVQNNFGGDTYLDDSGRLHILYTISNDGGILGTHMRHCAFTNGKMTFGRAKQVIRDGKRYAARMTQDTDGRYYIFYMCYQSTPELLIYRSENGTTGYELVCTKDFGLGSNVRMTYSGMVISSGRNNSHKDNTVQCAFPVSNSGGHGYDFYAFTVDLDSLD